jgi:hypothetical protein
MAQLCARARFNSWPTPASLTRSLAWLIAGIIGYPHTPLLHPSP